MQYQKWLLPEISPVEEFMFRRLELFIASNPLYRGKKVFLCGGLLRDKFHSFFEAQTEAFFLRTPYTGAAVRQAFARKDCFAQQFRAKVHPRFLLNMFSRIHDGAARLSKAPFCGVRTRAGELLSKAFVDEFFSPRPDSDAAEESESEDGTAPEPGAPATNLQLEPNEVELVELLSRSTGRMSGLSHNLRLLEFEMEGLHRGQARSGDFDLVVQAEYFSDFVANLHRFFEKNFVLRLKTRAPRIVRLPMKACKDYRFCSFEFENGLKVDIKEFKSKRYLSYFKQLLHFCLTLFGLRQVQLALQTSSCFQNVVTQVVFLDVFEENLLPKLERKAGVAEHIWRLRRAVLGFGTLAVTGEGEDLELIELIAQSLLQKLSRKTVPNNSAFYRMLLGCSRQLAEGLGANSRDDEARRISAKLHTRLAPLADKEQILESGLAEKKQEIDFLIAKMRPEFDAAVRAVLLELQSRHIRESTVRALRQDLKTRDFAINSLYFDFEERRVYDFSGAVEDIYRKRIEVNHLKSFVVDPKRFLRVFRFAGTMGLRLGPKARECVRKFVADSQRFRKKGFRSGLTRGASRGNGQGHLAPALLLSVRLAAGPRLFREVPAPVRRGQGAAFRRALHCQAPRARLGVHGENGVRAALEARQSAS